MRDKGTSGCVMVVGVTGEHERRQGDDDDGREHWKLANMRWQMGQLWRAPSVAIAPSDSDQKGGRAGRNRQ
jgi:hypothetical protein